MLSPPTICLDRDCQRRCDNCAFNLIMIILLRITLIYEIRSHNIKGINSPLKQVKPHTKAPSGETRVFRGECRILNLCQQCHDFLSVCDPILSEAEKKNMISIGGIGNMFGLHSFGIFHVEVMRCLAS